MISRLTDKAVKDFSAYKIYLVFFGIINEVYQKVYKASCPKKLHSLITL